MNLSQQIPRPVAIGLIIVAAIVSVAIAAVRLRSGPRATEPDLRARWVDLADRVHDLRNRGRQAEALQAATRQAGPGARAAGRERGG